MFYSSRKRNHFFIRKKMRYAICSEFAYPYSKGGVEKRYFDLANSLIKKNHSIVWFTTKNWEGKNEIIKNGIHYVGICNELNFKTSSGKRNILQPIIFGINSIKILYHRNKFDFIDISQYPFFHSFILFLICTIFKKKSVLSLYEIWGSHWFSYRNFIIGFFGIMIEKMQIFFARKIIIISDKGFKSLSKNAQKKTVLIPNWINFNKIQKSEIFEKKYDICYFGRLVKHKNVNKILSSIKKAKEKNIHLTAIIIGDGDQKNNLENLANKLGISNQVKFTGFIEKHSELLELASMGKIFVMLSDKEGGGSIVSIEANAIGLPVLCNNSQYGIDSSLILDDYNGYRIENNCEKEIIKKVVKYLNLSNKNKQSIYNNCKQFSRKFDISIATKKYINL